MKPVSVAELSNIGKGALALIVTVGGLLQVPSIGNPIMAFGKLHPHIAGAVGLITVLTTFLNNPQVQKAFNIQIPPDTKIEQEVKTTIQTPSEAK